MSISTYTELQSAVKNWMQRADITFNATDMIPDLILMGEQYINRHARTRDMEAALSVVIASGVAAIPSDFVALKYAYLDHDPVYTLQPQSASFIITAYPYRAADDISKYIVLLYRDCLLINNSRVYEKTIPPGKDCGEQEVQEVQGWVQGGLRWGPEGPSEVQGSPKG